MIEPATILNCVRIKRELEAYTGRSISERVWPTNDAYWTGQAGHEDTVQGKLSGKTDPGALFWTLYLSASQGDTVEEQLRLLNEALVKRFAIMGVGAGDYDQMLRAYEVLVQAGIIR